MLNYYKEDSKNIESFYKRKQEKAEEGISNLVKQKKRLVLNPNDPYSLADLLGIKRFLRDHYWSLVE